MDLKYSEMSVDTSLAQEYLKKNKSLSDLCTDYDEIVSKFKPYAYDGKVFIKKSPWRSSRHEHYRNILLNMASSLKQNATLIAQLEYYIRNIPIEVTIAQLNLIIQDMRCLSEKEKFYYGLGMIIYPNDSLLISGRRIVQLCKTSPLVCSHKETAAICHLLVTLAQEAGAIDCQLHFWQTSERQRQTSCIQYWPVKGLDSGTVGVVSYDADVDSAVAKFISVSKQAPWRLRRILVQENIYQQFKDALKWKCNLKQIRNRSLTSDVLCSEALTYNDITFLIDPVEFKQVTPSVVTVEAYRTTKEMISLVQQDHTRYLSLWTNGIAEINEVTHSVMSPVVWVNNVADFRGPPDVSEAVFSYPEKVSYLAKISEITSKVYEVSQSWQKLDVECRRDILCGVLDKCILINPTNKKYTEIRDSLLVFTPKTFVGAGKDYVCRGISKPVGFVTGDSSFSLDVFKSILLGNAILLFSKIEDSSVYELLRQKGVPVGEGEFENTGVPNRYLVYPLEYDSEPQVVWTDSGTIFAN